MYGFRVYKTVTQGRNTSEVSPVDRRISLNVANSNKISPIWDSPENMAKTQERVTFFTKGCKCEKSGCKNKLCKYVKRQTVFVAQDVIV